MFDIEGGWSSWSIHSCSKTCGGGIAMKHRTCTNPIPLFGGQACSGPHVTYVSCNTNPCQGMRSEVNNLQTFLGKQTQVSCFVISSIMKNQFFCFSFVQLNLTHYAINQTKIRVHLIRILQQPNNTSVYVMFIVLLLFFFYRNIS